MLENIRTDVKYTIAAVTAISLLASCAGGSSTPATSPAFQPSQERTVKHQTSCPCVYVTNADSVTVYPVGTNGDAKPLQDISGSETLLDDPRDIAVDSSGNMYVANEGNNSVTIYAAGATGDVAPTAVISGSKTLLAAPLGIALDPINDDIYVANSDGGPKKVGTITVYAPGSTGDVKPAEVLAGTDTQLDEPAGLALDSSANIYVANLKNNSITVYPAGSVGNSFPTQTIMGSNTKLDTPNQVALDSKLNIYAANKNSTVTIYASGANGNVKPSRTIGGTNTKLDGTDGVALNAGAIYAANYIDSTITFYADGANGNVAPKGIIAGANTKLDEPERIAIR